jgi:hypothetical protein
MNQKIIITTAALLSLSLVGGCASQTRTEAEFGDAVREVMRNQVHDKNAADYPEPDAVEGADPYRLEKVMEVHRGDVSEPRGTTGSAVQINVGSGSR